jgi:hypothetical protein
METDPVFETLCVLNKNRMMDNVQRRNICKKLHSLYTPPEVRLSRWSVYAFRAMNVQLRRSGHRRRGMSEQEMKGQRETRKGKGRSIMKMSNLLVVLSTA